ncbi:MAG: hypothetical protein KY475_03775 [Planctomycetes bacterium]|nr:hypothetical protein [Planctomycetota bacterium]
MANKHNQAAIPDLSEFARHRREIPLELAEQYAGTYVAWDLAGAHILASGESLPEVEAKVRQQGLEVCDVVFDFIDAPDQAWIG